MLQTVTDYTNSSINVLGSVTTPVTAAAAATNGLANIVRLPGPCRPSKFLFDVLTAYLPAGTLLSFIAKQAEQPGWRNSKPASFKISSKPSSFICASTMCDPGTSHAVTLGALCLPLIKEVNALKSSIRPLVQLPTKTKSTGLPIMLSP